MNKIKNINKMPIYQIELPGSVKIPKNYKNIVEVYATIGKLIKYDSSKYFVIYENDKFFRKVINPKYNRVTNEQWMQAHNAGHFKDAFILVDNGQKEYYIKP